MQNSVAVGISLPTKLMKKIDVERGDVPRSRYVLRILEKQYTLEGKNVVERGSLDREFGTLQSSKPFSH
jgi:metal-responsive CopG/Arc/MetJ family transcriptional regulator